MSNLQERLINCFSAVFPDLTPDEIMRAADTTVANWDSLATVTLVSVIEEEFDIGIMPEDYESLASFAQAHELIKAKAVNA